MHIKYNLHIYPILWSVLLIDPTFATDRVLSNEEFNLTVTKNGYSAPSEEIYRYLAEDTKYFTRGEIAMFIAQLIHESGGFKYTEQIECSKGNHCKGMYDDYASLPNRTYHGRGYIQLTWAANYKVASEDLGLGDKLLREPELVASDKRLAMRVSVWYWDARVKPLLKARKNEFGVTTKGINPGECVRGYSNWFARRRYRIYLKVAEALNISEKAKEDGCYD